MKIYLLTGLSGSGKTTLSTEICNQIGAEMLDGDIIREISNNQDFSWEGRKKHMRQVAAMANLLSKYTHVVISLISPVGEVREEIKKKFGIIEIFVDCSLEECKKRDVKGLYEKAMKGEIKDFTGISQAYDIPTNPNIIVDTEKLTVEESVKYLLEKIQDKNKKGILIGRWQPLHDGHRWLAQSVEEKGFTPLLAIRNTPVNDSNPFTVEERIEMIKKEGYDYFVMPDLGGVFYGRSVGYKVEELSPPKEISEISATKIRAEVSKND